MKHFEITGKLTNGYGETVSITVCNKKSCDVFYIGLEQAEELISLVQRHLTPAAQDSEGRCEKCGLWHGRGFEFCADCGKVLRCP